MVIVLYTFAVIVEILRLIVVVLIYSAVRTPFEIITVSLLIFILYAVKKEDEDEDEKDLDVRRAGK